MQQEQAKAADVAEDGRQVLDENEVAIDEDGYAEKGVGAAISGRTSNDMQKARGWDDSGDDCAGTSPDFYPAAPPQSISVRTNFNHNLMFETVLHH